MTGEIGVDLWALGRRSYEIHWPILQALGTEPSIDLRSVISDGNADLAEYQALPDPPLILPLPRGKGPLWFVRNIARERARVRHFAAPQRRIIHVALGTPWDLLYLPVAKRAGATVVMTVHDAVHHVGEESRLSQFVMDRVYGLADHLVVLSTHVRDGLVPRWRGRRPIHLLSSSLLTTGGPLLPPRPAPPVRPLRLLFFGRIFHYKGLDVLLDAMGRLQAGNIPAHLTVAGSGDYAPYRTQLDGLRNVTVQDAWISSEEKTRLFAEADVNMLPYREASQSGIAIDGLFAALPSVASRTGGLTEQLTEGEDVLFTPVEAPEEIAAAIRRLVEEPGLYERLSAGAHASALRRGPAQAAMDLSALYKSILT
jgi:glycosyltransferase involved in cell wall biosynthesis